MRFTYYTFPLSFTAREQYEILKKEGLTCLPPPPPNLSDDEIYRILGGRYLCSITTAKKMIRKYGGYGYTEHYDRNGTLFESTEIKIKGNNSRFRYNRHL